MIYSRIDKPWVTFDVNNSYVSQQLGQRVGEEVSHFYHPTPPPARNPSGFWERIEQRYKNNFERQALIAEGRAAANSEIMRESFGQAAAANQQHYLDLGYTDSVAQTRAGLIAGAELPLPPIAKGIMQASKLMNRWGLFGRNAVDSTAGSPNILQEVLKNAKLTPGKPNQLEVVLDDGSKVIFRRDIGEHAHSIGKDYPNPTDHYNIEIHIANPARPGKFTPQENVHIVVDEKLQPVDVFLKNKTRIFFDAERNNLSM